VALLLRDREAASEAATPPPGGASVVVPPYACEACGAGMQPGQDWCLECGTAARGRLGARAGWRAAFTVVGLTLLLVFGAGIAGYAALTSDAERTASAPTSGNGAPITAQAPTPGIPGPAATTITPGETGPGVTPPATTLPGVTPGAVQTPPPSAGTKLPVIPPTRPVTPATNQAVTPPPAAATQKSPSTATSTPKTSTATNGTTPSSSAAQQASVAPQLIALGASAAKTYNPGNRVGAEIGPAANAVDGKPNTPWDVTVPADGNPIGVGLLVDLGKPYALQSLRMATSTPGFSAELYGAVDAKELPADVLDKRWQHLTDVKSVADGAPISLKGKGEAPKFQLFLVYVTKAAEPTDPRAAIGELTLRGTP
jgi:hypothetical protein